MEQKTLGLGTGTNVTETSIDSGTSTMEEELSLQENLTVHNRDDLRGGEVLYLVPETNVSGNVADTSPWVSIIEIECR